MKLKCDKHDRRVLTVPGGSSFLHRTGDMSKCNSKVAVMQDNTSHITRAYKIVDGVLRETSCDKKSRPHTKRDDKIDLTRYTRPDTRSYEEATAPIDLETGLPIKE